MNVFVLCTGRCGSVTLHRACSHITNYTSGHETRARVVGMERLAYPANHIEADNRLSWFLGRLDSRYGNEAFYVHLTRNADAVAESFCARDWAGSIVRAYGDGILMGPDDGELAVSRDYVETVTANIELFLKDKTNWMPFRLEDAASDFPRLWERIGAEGDRDAAMSEWETRHNRTRPPQQKGALPTRAIRRLKRLVTR